MGKTLSTRAAQQIGQVVRDHRRSAPGTASRRGSRRPGGSGVREGILQADLDAASSEIDGATTADLKLLRPDPDNAGDLKLTDETIEVTNRSTSYSAAEGDYIQVERLNNEWRPRAAGGGSNPPTVIEILVLGGTTGGDLTLKDWTIDGQTGDVTLPYNASQSQSATHSAIQSHPAISSHNDYGIIGSLSSSRLYIVFTNLDWDVQLPGYVVDNFVTTSHASVSVGFMTRHNWIT